MRRLILPLLLALPVPASAAEPIEGRWITQNGHALVTIEKCGPVVCGRLTRVLMKVPTATPTDRFNPDPRLRNRPVVGIEILSGFKDAGADWRGTIYDAEHGKTYKSIVKREPTGLNVKGCIMLFCQAQHWTPAK